MIMINKLAINLSEISLKIRVSKKHIRLPYKTVQKHYSFSACWHSEISEEYILIMTS